MNEHGFGRALIATTLGLAVLVGQTHAATIIVAPTGGDYTTIQAALDVAQPGDTIQVKDKVGGYGEKISFPRSGSAANYITLEAFPGHHPIINGQGVSGNVAVFIQNCSYVKFIGFEITNFDVIWGSGICIVGSASHCELRNNVVHGLTGTAAMAITIFGTWETTSLSDIVCDGNEIYDIPSGPTDAFIISGYVENFQCTNNRVHDVTGGGISLVGGDDNINPLFVPNNGTVQGNQMWNCHSGDAMNPAVGLRVTGCTNLFVQGNLAHDSDLGIEVRSVDDAFPATNITLRDNVVHGNGYSGLKLGALGSGLGSVTACQVLNNTTYHNDRLSTGAAELQLQWAASNVLRNNVFVADGNPLLAALDGNTANSLDYNHWWDVGGSSVVAFHWNGSDYAFAQYRAHSQEDTQSHFSDPLFVDAGQNDFAITAQSPCVDAGDPSDHLTGKDFALNPRRLDGTLSGTARVDRGAFEFGNVHLAITGTASTGQDLYITVSGTAGLQTYMWLGTVAGETWLPLFGPVYMNFGGPWALVPWFVIPSTVHVVFPAGFPVGLEIIFQAMASNGARGNTSNPVQLTVQ